MKKKSLVKSTSIYKGTLMTFQHYLNTYHFVLPFEDAYNGQHLYKISEWYKKGILVRVLIDLPTHTKKESRDEQKLSQYSRK